MSSVLKNIRSKINSTTVFISFVLSIMIINNYNQCNKYDESDVVVKTSYYFAILILVIACLLLLVILYDFLYH